ncbi:MAG: hypothetical protein JNM66_32435 [Bryobacterales bacterium]|nr:hypothetical protein [Bryobacterales bacterium]
MMRHLLLPLALIGFLPGTPAQASKRQLIIDITTPEGATLKHLVDVPDPAQKLILMEDFAVRFPAHPSTSWVLGELQTIYSETGRFALAIATGERILKLDPDDIAISHNNLKAAEAATNAELVRKWAHATALAARRVATAARPAETDEASWRRGVDYAKQVAASCEYKLYALAVQASDVASRLEWSETLTRLNPASSYGPLIRQQVFISYQQAGNHTRAQAMVDEDLRANRASDDMLLYAASRAYARQDRPKVILYAKRLLDKLATQSPPEGVTIADWTKGRNAKQGLAQWMLGVMASNEQRWPDADQHLRAALPNVGQNKAISAEALYHLGLANYKLGEAKNDKNRIADALKYNMLCAAIAGDFQAQAKLNVASIRSQFHLQ